MPTHTQRFCPLCNRGFAEGEAVLRCVGCDVRHHPGCWVKNEGCATASEHEARPVAIAYSSKPPSGVAPHPAEGTRVLKPQGADALPDEGEEPVIGAAPATPLRLPPPGDPGQPAQFVRRTTPLPESVQPPTPPRRYVPAPPGPGAGPKPLPRIYGRHAILGYWYVPVAAVLAIGVAFGVVWAFDRLDGGGDGAAATTATSTQQATTEPASTAEAVTGTPLPAATGTPGTAAGKFRAGDVVVVTGTGGCLNIRVAPGRANDAIICLDDGETLTITGGPSTADSLTWWKVQLDTGEGWGAEDYLSKRP